MMGIDPKAVLGGLFYGDMLRVLLALISFGSIGLIVFSLIAAKAAPGTRIVAGTIGLGLLGCMGLCIYRSERRKPETEFQFDLSKSHQRRDVHWPASQTSDTFAHDGNCILVLKLPENRIFHEHLTIFLIERREDSVTSIEGHMHPMSLEEVRVQGGRLMKAWHFDDRKFAAWVERTRQRENDERFETMRNDLHPSLALKVLHSFDDQRPWFISFEVDW